MIEPITLTTQVHLVTNTRNDYLHENQKQSPQHEYELFITAELDHKCTFHVVVTLSGSNING